MNYVTLHDAVTNDELRIAAELTWIVRKAKTGTTHVISPYGAMHPVAEDVETVTRLLSEAKEKVNGSREE